MFRVEKFSTKGCEAFLLWRTNFDAENEFSFRDVLAIDEKCGLYSYFFFEADPLSRTLRIFLSFKASVFTFWVWVTYLSSFRAGYWQTYSGISVSFLPHSFSSSLVQGARLFLTLIYLMMLSARSSGSYLLKTPLSINSLALAAESSSIRSGSASRCYEGEITPLLR